MVHLTPWFYGALLAFAFAATLPVPALPAAQDAEPQKPAAVRGSFDHGLLWRIEKPGVVPSYLFGTIHLADSRAAVLPPVVKQRLDAARSFTMEVALDAPNVALLATRMLYLDGRDLESVAGEPLFRRVAPLMAGYGMPEPVVRRFKPWAVTVMLSVPPQRSDDVLDHLLYRIASEQGKALYFLETVDDQVGVFESFSEADQVAMLSHAVDTRADLDTMTSKLLDAYMKRDLASMWAISESDIERHPQFKPLRDAFMQRLLFDRNVRMLEKMRPQLGEGDAFIAVAT
jgi:uncharacterized protein YbaP (TraB family)